MKERLTFVRIPKNASTSIYNHTRLINTIVDWKMPMREEHLGIFAPSHCSLSQAVKTLGDEILKKIVFAVCRNPYDRMVSQYCFVQNQKFIPIRFKDFSEFVDFCIEEDTIASHSQSYYLDVDTDIDVLRFEDLSHEWIRFMHKHRLFIVSPDIPHVNKTKHNDYTEYYTPSIKDKVRELWSEDFKRFNYPV